MSHNNNNTNDIVNMIQSYNSIMLIMINIYNRRINNVSGSTSSTLSNSNRSLNSLIQSLLSRSTTAVNNNNDDDEEVVMSFLFEPSMGTSTTTSATGTTVRTARTAASVLTQRQILENTRVFSYSTERDHPLLNTTCPISHLDFENGDILCELNHCHHVFKYNQIMRWLSIDSTCPVCRSLVEPSITL